MNALSTVRFWPLSERSFAYFGALVAAYLFLKYIWRTFDGLKAFILSPVLGLSLNVKNLGQWAVVTGATDGCGKAFATELARRGMNIVLISRSLDKLNEVASEIAEKYGVSTKVIQADFSQGEPIYNNLSIQLTGLDIGILVNNVGVSYEFPQYFLEVENLDEFIKTQVNVNALSVIKMTRIVLPGMVEKRKGAIINMSSASGLGSCDSLLTLYSSLKAFVAQFSTGLCREYKSKGITIQCVAPYYVATKMSKIRNPGLFWPSPTKYVRSVLGTLGLQDLTTGCLPHCIQDWFIRDVLPEWLYVRLSANALGGLRKRGLAKRAKLNK